MTDMIAVVHKAEHLIDAVFSAEIKKNVADFDKKLSKLRRAVITGPANKIKETEERVLNSFSAKLCCLVMSINKKKDGPVTAEELCEMAGELDAFSDTEEPVLAYAKIKSIQGDWRAICEFGPRRKALQTLINFVLIAKFGSHPLDYMAHGRGAEVAADRIVQLIGEGINHFVVADIESCFRSVKQETIGDLLGLPPAVVSHCLLIGEDVSVLPSYVPDDVSPKAFSEAVRQGLPQGARSSNRVISQLLGPELGLIASDGRIILYGDDVAIAADTREEADTFAKILRGSLDVHPAGPFRLKRCEVVSPSEKGFNFLKYKFRRDWLTGKIKARPSDLSYYRFRYRVKEIVRDEPIDKIYCKVMAYRTKWLMSFRRYNANGDALFLLWQSSIYTLPPHLLDRWESACVRHASAAGGPIPSADDDWLPPGLVDQSESPTAGLST